jgi:hypothetical protein
MIYLVLGLLALNGLLVWQLLVARSDMVEQEDRLGRITDAAVKLAVEVVELREKVSMSPGDGWVRVSPPDLIGDLDNPVDIRA